MEMPKRYWLRGAIVGVFIPFVIALLFVTFFKMPGPHNDEWFLKYGSIIHTYNNTVDPLHLWPLINWEFESRPPIILPEILLIPATFFLILSQWIGFGIFGGWLYGKYKNRKRG